MAANNTNFYVHAAGTWRSAEPWVKVGGVWKAVQEVHVKVGGVWQHSYQRSNPTTLTFGPAWTKSYIEGGDPVAYTFNGAGTEGGSMIQGDWDTVGHASGTQRGKGAAGFTGIESAMGGRYTCTLIRVRLTVESQYTSNGIYARVGLWQNFLSSSPATFGHSHSNYQATSPSRLNPGEDHWVTLSNTAGNLMLDSSRNTITTHDWSDATDNAAKEYYRGTFYGESAASADEPKVEITADY